MVPVYYKDCYKMATTIVQTQGDLLASCYISYDIVELENPRLGVKYKQVVPLFLADWK